MYSTLFYLYCRQNLIKRVVEEEKLIKENLARILGYLDGKAESGDLVEVGYAKAVYGYFNLVHENPLLFQETLTLESGSIFNYLMKIQTSDSSYTPEELTNKMIEEFKSQNPLHTSHIDGSTEFDDVGIITLIMSVPERFKDFTVNKTSFFTFSDIVDYEDTKVHRSEFSVDVELYFQDGKEVRFVFPTFRQNYINAFHSVSSLAKFWDGAASLDKDTTDVEIAYSNMAGIFLAVKDSIKYFASQVNVSNLQDQHDLVLEKIKREFDDAVSLARPAPVLHISQQQTSTYIPPYTPYVSMEETLRAQNEVLKETNSALLTQNSKLIDMLGKTVPPTVSLESNGPVKFTITYGDK